MIPSYPSTFHWPDSLTVHRDDHYHVDPQRFVGEPIVVTEKLDGGVTGIASGSVYARSSADPTHEPWFSYVKSVTLPKLYSLDRALVVWGEDLFGVHSIEYDPLPDTYFVFHVLQRLQENIQTEHTEGDRFWAWDNVMLLARDFGLLHVPVVFQGTFRSVAEITEFFMENIGKPSYLGPEREGFVMRMRDSFGFEDFNLNTCKFVRDHHVQTDQHWKKNWKRAKIAR